MRAVIDDAGWHGPTLAHDACRYSAARSTCCHLQQQRAQSTRAFQAMVRTKDPTLCGHQARAATAQNINLVLEVNLIPPVST